MKDTCQTGTNSLRECATGGHVWELGMGKTGVKVRAGGQEWKKRLQSKVRAKGEAGVGCWEGWDVLTEGGCKHWRLILKGHGARQMLEAGQVKGKRGTTDTGCQEARVQGGKRVGALSRRWGRRGGGQGHFLSGTTERC